MPSLRLAFAGTPDFAARHLQALINGNHDIVGVLTQPDRPAGRGKKARPSPVKVLAQEHKLSVLQPASLRDPTAVADVAKLRLDVLVVVAYGLILPQAVLDLPRLGCLNVHGSLLPRWRGAAPIQRAIEAGDPESGVTVMLMDAGLDTGPMLAKESCAITQHTSSGDLYDQLADIGPALLSRVLEDLPSYLKNATEQDDQHANYAAKISKDEALIDWAASATIIARRIRALNPAPGCFTFLNGQRIKVWAAHAAAEIAPSIAPGTITSTGDHGISVRCGEGVLVLELLQMAGAKAMQAKELLRGHSEVFAPGSQFTTEAGA